MGLAYLASGPLSWCSALVALLELLLDFLAQFGVGVLVLAFLGRHDGRSSNELVTRAEKGNESSLSTENSLTDRISPTKKESRRMAMRQAQIVGTDYLPHQQNAQYQPPSHPVID